MTLASESGHMPPAPRALPPWIVDLLVAGGVTVLYIAQLVSHLMLRDSAGGVTLGTPVWTTGTAVGALCLPFVLSLWWRRRHPRMVLAIALLVTVVANPYAGPFAFAALLTAGIRLGMREVLLAWASATLCFIVGQQVSDAGLAAGDVLAAGLNAGLPLAVGAYVGTRRAYVDRLRERALFARALASFLPADVADLVRTAPSALSLHEEREATVLFSDVRGFSRLAEDLPPRDVAELLNRHLAAMSDEVVAAGGTLDKFAGDGVMALFGVPRAVDGHAAAAVNCAIAMQRRQAADNADARFEGRHTLEIGIGINSGQVIAGAIGTPGRYDYTVIGDAVNVAQRLQAQAGGGVILASRATIDASGAPAAEPIGPLVLKGRRNPIDAFRIPWAASQPLREAANRSDEEIGERDE